MPWRRAADQLPRARRAPTGRSRSSARRGTAARGRRRCPSADVQPALLAARQRLDPGVRLLARARPARSPRRRAAGAGSSRGCSLSTSRTVRYGSTPAPWSTMPTRSRNARPPRARVVAEHLDLAGVGVAEALQDLDRRGLARAVGSEQREHLAFLDPEVEAPHGVDVAVRLAQALHLDRHHGGEPTALFCDRRGGPGPLVGRVASAALDVVPSQPSPCSTSTMRMPAVHRPLAAIAATRPGSLEW